MTRLNALLSLCAAAALGVTGAALGQAGNNMQMQLRIVAQSGTPSAPSGVVDLSGPARVTAAGQVRRFEVQYRVRLTGTGPFVPEGLAAARLRITASGDTGNGTLERAVLSRFESQTNLGTSPPGPVDASGVSTGALSPPNEARGLHSPFRGAIAGAQPGNGSAANGVISANGQTLSGITAFARVRPDQSAAGGPDGFGAYYGLYSFNYIGGAIAGPGVVTLTASLDSDLITADRYSFYDGGSPVPVSSPNGLDASMAMVIGPPGVGVQGACCRSDGSCTATTSDACSGSFMGAVTSCSPAVCPVGGACCPATGGCALLTAAACVAQGGTWLGSGAACGTSPCPPPYACCFSDFSCLIADTQMDCVRHDAQVRFSRTCTPQICCPAATITAQPQGIAYLPFQSVVLTVGTAPGGTQTFQWRKDGVNLVDTGRISGSATNVLTLLGALATDAGVYDVVVRAAVVGTACDSSLTSAAAVLTPCGPPTITASPVAPAAPVGSAVMLTVQATGPGTLLYQWYKNGTPLLASTRTTGVNSPVLSITGVGPGDDGAYSVVVRSACGVTVSDLTAVTVTCVGEGGALDCNSNALCDALELGGLRDITAPDPGVHARFGYAVAIDGSRLLVGAHAANTEQAIAAGAAYIYSNVGSGWALDATLTASDGGPAADFGNQVAIEGQWAVVGARKARVMGQDLAGAAYIFRNIGAGWTFFQKLTEPTPTDHAQFGHGIDLDGDRVLIGALAGNGVQPGSGAAYVFRYNGADWGLEQTLGAPDGATGDGFGISVAISGAYAIVGSPYDIENGMNSGSAYVFFRSATGWMLQSKLGPREPQPGETFAEVVAMSGDYAVCACPREVVGGVSQAGAVYTFRRTDTRWPQQSRLVAPTPQVSELFGFYSAIEGDTLVAGGFRRQVGGFADAGAVDVFKRRGNSWARADRIDCPKPETPSFFGYALAISGGKMAAGADLGSAGTVLAAGWVRVFDLNVLDCNDNGVPDVCEIAAGTLIDADRDGVPDGCQSGVCRADFNGNGVPSVQDIFDFLADYFAGNMTADFDNSGVLGTQDIFDYIAAFFVSCG